jgi:DNA-binding NtrC family response regulator
MELAGGPIDEAGAGLAIRDGLPLNEAITLFEQYYIARTLRQHDGQKGKTAAVLDVNRKTLYQKLKKYGIV